jgi:superfamily II DNA or RNA helicase
VLRSVDIVEEYRSDRNSILHDFLIPCLAESQQYDRAVGFFTSSSLSMAARGLVEFVKKGGSRVRLIASPRLEPEDVEAIQKGYDEREEILSRRLIEGITNPLNSVEKDRLAILAWLIANKILDVRIAFRISENPLSIYHEKVGILYDEQGESIAFAGSPNETRAGLVDNFECIDVYKSWIEPTRVERKAAAFDDLWENRTQGIQVLPFPEVARRKLLEIAPDKLPSQDPEYQTVLISKTTYDLWDHQRDAIDFWKENDYKAIFAMATGSGKTFTALRAIEHLLWKGYTAIVIAPRRLLLSQWNEEIKKHLSTNLILPCTGESGWRENIHSFLRLCVNRTEKYPDSEPTFITTTMNTASSEEFVKIINAYGDRTKFLVIADETHWLGAPTFSNAMEINADPRIGLSATHVRMMDEEGTDRILEFFGNNVYEYSLEQAIADGCLVPYDYIVREVHLTPNEYDEYVKLTKKIGRKIASSGKIELDEIEGLEALIFRRARIVKASDNKRGFIKWVHDQFHPEKCLVYCENIEHAQEVAKDLSAAGAYTVTYHSGLSHEDRKEAMDRFRDGIARYIVSIRCLDEGIDIPDCRSAIILSSSTNSREFLQRRGRVLRKALEKRKAIIFDPIVVPGGSIEDSNIMLGQLEQELRRVVSFAKSATPLSRIETMRIVSRIRERFAIAGVDVDVC